MLSRAAELVTRCHRRTSRVHHDVENLLNRQLVTTGLQPSSGRFAAGTGLHFAAIGVPANQSYLFKNLVHVQATQWDQLLNKGEVFDFFRNLITETSREELSQE